MLSVLRIKNLALVSDLTLELSEGFHVFTGETGAGKSVILGALNLLLGQRADRSLIRSGSESCSVEAVFQIQDLRSPLARFLEEHGLEPCEDGQLLVRRTLSSTGAGKQFINGSATTLSVLAEIGEWLIDLHGPHDHQSLLQPLKQLLILDAFAGLEKQREQFNEILRERHAIAAQKSALIVDDQTYQQQLGLLRFQVQEIQLARLDPNEEESLEVSYRRVSQAARLIELTQEAQGALDGDEAGLFVQIGRVGRVLQELTKLDSSGEPLREMLEMAGNHLQELQQHLARYADQIEVDPERLMELTERLQMVQGLKRKYGSSIPAILAFEAEASSKLKILEGRDEEVARLTAAYGRKTEELTRLGATLSKLRKAAGPKLAAAVAKELAVLGFKQSRVEISLESNPEALTHGFDRIEFQFAPNPGEPAKPLRAIASSGELARVMLALKVVLAAEDEVPVLMFDEVDANVGGETAHAVGKKMRQIAGNHQVLCITHLAPVAALGDSHWLVSKEVRQGRTESFVSLMDEAGRVEELARMLGGGSAARNHASALLTQVAKERR